MALVVGLAGFTGAGKTSAIRYLAPRLGAAVVYLGEAVRLEVVRRGLLPIPENERKVRLELRQNDPAALARSTFSKVQGFLDDDQSVFIDAVMSPYEREFYIRQLGKEAFTILAIDSPFEARVQRVGQRTGRRATKADVRRRDATEIRDLSIDVVLREANFKIYNDRGRSQLHDALFGIKHKLICRAGIVRNGTTADLY